jgi:Fe-S-cluster formation regulator IscX/YfhJ
MTVIGIGEKKTPSPFIIACDKFIYIEILKAAVAPPKELTNKKEGKPKATENSLNKIDEATIRLLTESVADLADESGWTFLGNLGSFVLKRKPDFDPRNYGFPKMLSLIKSINKFEIDERETGKNNIRHIYLRIK